LAVTKFLKSKLTLSSEAGNALNELDQDMRDQSRDRIKEARKCRVGHPGPACSLPAVSASAVGGRRAAGGSARGLQSRREIHPEIAGRRDNDRAIPEQGYGRLEMAVLGAPTGHIHAA
jgi:hypothetical protein